MCVVAMLFFLSAFLRRIKIIARPYGAPPERSIGSDSKL